MYKRVAQATPEQPLKGKYDPRYGKRKPGFRVPHRKGINSRCKPQWLKNLGAKHAIDLVQEFDAVVPPSTLYTEAYAKKDLRLCWEMREAVLERVLGKPYVAVNPELSAQNGSVLHEDKRLQLAVGTMIINPSVLKGKRTRKQLADDSQDIRGQLIEASSAVSQDMAIITDSKDFVGFNDVEL
jgi:hypothetical protein